MKNCFLSLFCFFLLTDLAKGEDFKTIIKGSKDDSTVVEAYSGLMKSFETTSVDSVKFYATQALQYFRDRKYPKGECIINLNMANILLFHGGLAEAESYCKEGIAIAKKQGWLKYLARGYNLITVVYGKRGEFVESTRFALEALRANEKLNDKRGIIASYLKLSAISVELKKFKQAIDYADVADSINNATIKSVDLEIGINNNKAIAYAEMKRLDESLAMFNKIYQIAINNPEIGNGNYFLFYTRESGKLKI